MGKAKRKRKRRRKREPQQSARPTARPEPTQTAPKQTPEHKHAAPRPEKQIPSSPSPPSTALDARNDRSFRRPLAYRQDLIVVGLTVAVMALGSIGYRSLTQYDTTGVEVEALRFKRPSSMLPARPLSPVVPRAKSTPVPAPPDQNRQHLVFSAHDDARTRIEVRVEKRPHYGNIRGALNLARRLRYGNDYWSQASKVVSLRGTDWLRTEFQHFVRSHRHAPPAKVSAVEFATVHRGKLYSISLHGEPPSLSRLIDVVRNSLDVAGTDHAALSPTFGYLSSDEIPPQLQDTMTSVVLVLAVDTVDERMIAISSGSGTTISANGIVLTNHHVIFDHARERYRDMFVIGRLRPGEREPDLVCIGDPKRGKDDPQLDLALIQCDRDMDGRPWRPRRWPTATLRQGPPILGEPVWIAGYPQTAGGTATLTSGQVQGWTGEQGGQGRAFTRTNAVVSPGSSGGAAVDKNGNVIGIPTAYRIQTRGDGTTQTVIGKVGLIRPLSLAQELIASEQALDAASEPNTLVRGEVVDADSGIPVSDAVVIASEGTQASQPTRLAPWIHGASNRATTDHKGVFEFAMATKGTYTFAVFRANYWPLIVTKSVSIGTSSSAETSPAIVRPWPRIEIRQIVR